MSRQLRQNIRNFLLPLTIAEVERELELSQERGDTLRACYVAEWLAELRQEEREVNDCSCDDSMCETCNPVQVSENLVNHPGLRDVLAAPTPRGQS